MAKPTNLEFRLEDNQLFGFDPIGKADYEIRWCGNGQYSHYVLRNLKKVDEVLYVYADEKDPLYLSIRHAEMIMIYKAVLCTVCKTKYIASNYSVCYDCERRNDPEIKFFYPTFYKTLKADVLKNYGMQIILQALIEISEELNTNNENYLNVLKFDLQTTFDHYKMRNELET